MSNIQYFPLIVIAAFAAVEYFGLSQKNPLASINKAWF